VTASRISAIVLAMLVALALSASCSSQPSGVAGALHFDASDQPDTQPDAAGVDAPVEAPAPCDPTAPPGDGVFVSSNGDDGAQGTELAPFKTIAMGLATVQETSKSTLYLEEGEYDETLVLTAANSGIIIDGGWTRTGAAWQRDCTTNASDKTLIASPNNVGASLDPGVVATLRHLAVTTETHGEREPGQPGESCYGVMVQGGATLIMNDVNVTAGAGGHGGAATLGLQPSAPPCDGVTDCSDGAKGAAGSPGAAAGVSGSFDTTGYLPASGSDGTPGAPGEDGTAGGAGSTGACALTCTPPSCSDAAPTTGDSGTCGCGGPGGAPGGRGQGGGASVGVLAVGTTTTVSATSTSITAQDGGDGSPGGNGVDGQAGTPGAAGQPVTCTQCLPIFATCIPEQGTLAGGTAGGDGGPGGAGGPGGDGAGGPSYAIVAVGGAAVNLDAASTLAFGNGGQGAGLAASGAAGKRLKMP
jgi:hypothetical protein